jgi:hypothetical protein
MHRRVRSRPIGTELRGHEPGVASHMERDVDAPAAVAATGLARSGV